MISDILAIYQDHKDNTLEGKALKIITSLCQVINIKLPTDMSRIVLSKCQKQDGSAYTLHCQAFVPKNKIKALVQILLQWVKQVANFTYHNSPEEKVHLHVKNWISVSCRKFL